MHFNIYIPDQVGEQLNQIAKESGETRNSLIRHAVEAWVAYQVTPEWPEEILSFKGINNFPPFEKYRKRLKKPKKDPLA